NTRDYLVPSVWGSVDKRDDPYASAAEVKFDFTEDLPSISYSLNEPYDGTYLNMLYLTGSLPISTSNESIIPKCEKIEIICESHDQGWSSYPQDQGTYNNSWTWGEVSIVSSRQNNNLQDQLTEINEEVIEKESNVRYEIYRNRHADSDWQTHQYEFVSEHPLVQNLQPGDMITDMSLGRVTMGNMNTDTP
ncbi:2561_t:CDS:2, partial [Scutellospora calospora]